MTLAAELLGSEHTMSESTRHELLRNGGSSDLVNISHLHSAVACGIAREGLSGRPARERRTVS